MEKFEIMKSIFAVTQSMPTKSTNRTRLLNLIDELYETDRRTFHTEEACIEEAGYKYNQLENILKEYPDEHFTLRVYCEPEQKDSI